MAFFNNFCCASTPFKWFKSFVRQKCDENDVIFELQGEGKDVNPF